MSRSPQEELISFLSDLYAVELQALSQLNSAPGMTTEPSFAGALREHAAMSGEQAERLRQRLEALGESPSTIKDALMKLGGKGFLLLARVQTKTPGRLLVHTYAYEAMEWAGYTLLRHFASLADDEETAKLAVSARQEERRMMDRLEQCFDLVETEVNAKVQPKDIDAHVKTHLAEAHALEKQSLVLLESAVKAVGDSRLQAVYQAHGAETREQIKVLEGRLEELGGEPSTLKDAALKLGALDWNLFFRSQEDTGAKLSAFVYAYEHLEIAAYELLLRSSRRAADFGTVRLAERLLDEERSMARKLSDLLEEISVLELEPAIS